MKLKHFVWLALLALAVGALGWAFRSVSDESQIQEQLKQLAKLASYADGEGPIAKQRAIGKLKAFFTPGVVLNVNLQGQEPYAVETRYNLMQSIQQIRFAVPAIRLEFLDPKVELDTDRKTATVKLTLRARLGLERQEEYQEMKARFEKTPDGWLIARLDTVKTWGR